MDSISEGVECLVLSWQGNWMVESVFSLYERVWECVCVWVWVWEWEWVCVSVCVCVCECVCVCVCVCVWDELECVSLLAHTETVPAELHSSWIWDRRSTHTNPLHVSDADMIMILFNKWNMVLFALHILSSLNSFGRCQKIFFSQTLQMLKRFTDFYWAGPVYGCGYRLVSV